MEEKNARESSTNYLVFKFWKGNVNDKYNGIEIKIRRIFIRQRARVFSSPLYKVFENCTLENHRRRFKNCKVTSFIASRDLMDVKIFVALLM